MKMKYIQKIKANITISATKKTTNILDGNYKSIYKGKTLNFEDLREYVIGDNIRDIDWKASARSNSLLVRQYIAEKKHNIMLVLDSGKKMLADTKENEIKKNIAILAAGIMACLANKNGDYVGAIYSIDNLLKYFQFKQSLYNIEEILATYDSNVENTTKCNIEQSLDFVVNNINKRMIIVIFTDIDGMESIQETTLKKLTLLHDVLLINISDADATGNKAYDLDDKSYFPKLILNDSKLHELEKNLKKELYEKNLKKFEKYNITTVTVDSDEKIIYKIIELLERHKNANIR